jgi:hypothetical protein
MWTNEPALYLQTVKFDIPTEGLPKPRMDMLGKQLGVGKSVAFPKTFLLVVGQNAVSSGSSSMEVDIVVRRTGRKMWEIVKSFQMRPLRS